MKRISSVKLAYKRALEFPDSIAVNGERFAALGWQSSTTGQTSGPFYVKVFKSVAVEVKEDGKFVDCFPATSQYYFPWGEQ